MLQGTSIDSFAVNAKCSISNCSQIGDSWDRCSEWIKKASKGGTKYDFSKNGNDFLFTYFADGTARQVTYNRGGCSPVLCRSNALLMEKKGYITPLDVMWILRDHRGSSGPDWSPGVV